MLSIIIPVYNEIKTIEKILVKIKKIRKIKKQIIIVDDASNDGTTHLLKKLKRKYKINKILYNLKNMGKGYSIRRAQKCLYRAAD